MKEFFFDFETRSELDLRKVGPVKYAKHPSTQATLLTWAIDNGPVKEWRLGQEIPNEIITIAARPQDYKFIAHNIEFDYLIWIIPFKRQMEGYGNKPPVSNLDCTMALAQRFSAGRSLDAVAKIFKLPTSKDKVGRQIMLKQCKPDRKGQFPELTQTEWEQFAHYGKIDTVLLRQVYRILPKLSPAERWAWEWTFKRNMMGLRLDMDLLRGMERLLKIEAPRLNNEFNEIVGHQFTVTQRNKALAWFQKYLPKMKDMRSETIRDILADPPPQVPKPVLRALEIRSIIGSASIKKVRAALDREVGGRIYQNLVYNGAHTKRWAGSGIQVHNFPRSEEIPGGVIEAIQIVKESPEVADMMYDNGTTLVKNLLRRIFIPDPGKSFYCGDYSKIEPTVLFWLVGLGTPPKKWYEDMASTIYECDIEAIKKDSDERQLGKAAALGCGYGMGHVKFRADVKRQQGVVISTELAQKAVYAYRKKYSQVVKFWYALENAFSAAISGQATSLCGGKIIISPMTGRCRGVSIQIPSGSRLFYHDASWSPEGIIFQQAKQGKVMDKGLYGGLLTEHVVSSTSRDIMLHGMFQAEKNGFEILNTVHDEDWAQAEKGRLEEFKTSMLTLPKWCQGLELTVEAEEGERYLK